MERKEEISRYAVGVGLKVRDEALMGGLDFYTAETISALAQSSVIKGAEWADENPRNGLVDIEKACKKLEKCMYDNLMFQGRLHRKEVIETFIEDFKKHLEEQV